MSEANLPLAGDFPQLDAAARRRLAEASLKGQPLEKLAALTADGIPLLPIYARETHPGDEGRIGLPGWSAFTLGAGLWRGDDGHGWDIRQRVQESDLPALISQVSAELERGATAVELRWDR